MSEDENKIYLLNNDIIFKNIFSDEESLIRLLESVLLVKIKSVKSVNTELNKVSVHSKKMVLDLVVETEDGIINVELNNKCAGYVINLNINLFFFLTFFAN